MAMNDDVFREVLSEDLWGEDPAELDRTEELLSALGSGNRPHGGDDAEAALIGMLGDWRAQTEAGPIPPLPSQEEISAALAPNVVSLADRAPAAARKRGRQGNRHPVLRSLTGAAAAVAMLTGGVSVAAYGTGPSDPLWGVHQAMFSENASVVELVSNLNDDLDRAELAAAVGDVETARELLRSVTDRLGEVSRTEDRVALIQRRDAIERNLNRVEPAPVTAPDDPHGGPDDHLAPHDPEHPGDPMDPPPGAPAPGQPSQLRLDTDRPAPPPAHGLPNVPELPPIGPMLEPLLPPPPPHVPPATTSPSPTDPSPDMRMSPMTVDEPSPQDTTEGTTETGTGGYTTRSAPTTTASSEPTTTTRSPDVDTETRTR